ncbi:MAG: hypothetical protein AB8F95_11865, partial [Bacteroidia bacterium]
MESEFLPKLNLLKQALQNPGFRFVIVEHNHPSIYADVENWLTKTLSHRDIEAVRFEGKSYREIVQALEAIDDSVALVRDFDSIFREKNKEVCLAFNQRRDHFAKRGLTIVAFIQPANFKVLPQKIPDWWSLRSLELGFMREVKPTDVLLEISENSSLGGGTKEEKYAEIARLEAQLLDVGEENTVLKPRLLSQLARLYYDLSAFEKALGYLQEELSIVQDVGDRQREGAALNNIS